MLQGTTLHTVGLDLGKRFMQVHGADATGEKLLNRRLRRDQVAPFFEALPPCCVAIETCGGGHHWGRVLGAMGHTVKLIPAQFVKPYLKSNKNDAADAAAICEAAQRPAMRFAKVKTAEDQAMLTLHRTRRLLIKQRTQRGNSLRGQGAEFGLVAPQNRAGVAKLLAIVADPEDDRLPALARSALGVYATQLEQIGRQIAVLETQLAAWHRQHPVSQRLAAIPGVGVLTATALTVALGDGRQFRSGRQFAASLGLVPRQEGTGGKTKLKGISKRGDTYLRSNLVHGARSSIFWRLRRDGPGAPRLQAQVAEKSIKVVAVAVANRNARTAWALVRRDRTYTPGHVSVPPAAA